MSDMAGSRVLDELLRQARPEQREAVTAVEPLVVVGAGAGTGKTKTLAWRFLWALLAFPETRVENILTLTFTEKAAREMRERIGKMLSAARETAESLGLGETALRLADAENRLDEAYLSTIHAFALRVIRESGLVLPVDPKAGIVSPPREEAFWESFSAALDSLDPAEGSRGLPDPWRSRAETLFASAELASAVDTWGPEAVADFARAAVALHGSRGMSPEALWEWDPSQDEDVRLGLLSGRIPAWEDRLAFFRDEVFPGLGDLSKEKTALGRKLDAFSRTWRPCPPGGEGPERLLAFLEELDSTLKGASGRLKDTLAELLGQPPAELRKALQDELPLARSLVNGLSAEERSFRKSLAQTAALAWARWDHTKAESGNLSFDDLIRHAARAVSANPAYGKRFLHILVDEVQDTDPLQDALIGSLWEKGGGRLFMVGDLKQSIYRFRHAEPVLFAGRIRAAAQGRAGRYVLLDRSYRMREGLVRFVNACFGPLWEGELGRGLEIAYEALRGPDDASWWEARNGLGTPPVCLLLETRREDPVSGETEKKPVIRRRLADRLAGHLAELRGKSAWDKDQGALRPLSWRDMAVLVPGRTHYPALQDAFEAAGIPAVFQKSQGFFSRGEVFDLVSLLKALADPGDRAALAGWLASPFSGLCKEDALRLADAPERDGTSLHGRFREAFPEAAERFGALRAKAMLAGPAAALEDLLGDPSALLSAPQADRPRMAANLAHATALAREFSAARGPSLAACAETLGNALRRALPTEEPDFFAEDEDVVRVMTVHAAKGLEFPVVAVMGLDEEFRGDSRRTSLVPSVPLACVASALPGGDEAHAVLWHRALEDEALQEEWERLFYVASTRAQDVLLLCGICPLEAETGLPAPGEGTWLSMLESAFPGSLERALGEIPETLPGSPGPERAETQRTGTEWGHRLPGDPPALASVSATSFALFSRCPRAWRLQVRQGLELAWEKPAAGEPGGPDLGNLAHRILSEWDFTPESLDRLLPETLQGPTDRALLRLPPELRAPARVDKNRETLRAALAAFPGTPTGQKIAAARREGTLRREWPFRVDLEGGPALAGVIDALWEEEGTVHVVDYKFAHPSDEMEDLGFSQLAFYGAVIRKLFPGRRVDPSLFFLKPGTARALPPGSFSPEEVEARVRAMARIAATGPFDPNPEKCPGCPWRESCASSLKMGE